MNNNIKKLPGAATDNDLLSILEDTRSNEVLEKPNEHSVIQFLANFGIYPGVNRIKSVLLYKLYKHSVKNAVSLTEFYLIVDGYLENKTTQVKYYYINREPFDVTKQAATFLAKKKSKKKYKTHGERTNFELFLQKAKISEGTFYIPVTALYYFHKKIVNTRISLNTFVALIKLYFKTKHTLHSNCMVGIDKNQLTEEEIKTSIEWAKDYHDKRLRKKDPPRKK